MTRFETQAFGTLNPFSLEKNKGPHYAKKVPLTKSSVSVIGFGITNTPSHLSPHPAPHLESWEHLHRRVWQNPDGVEFQMEWTVKERTEAEVAKKVARRIQPWFANDSHNHRQNRLTHIQVNIETFVGFTQRHLDGIMGYEIRVAAMHGESATRCASFHVDHVPVRSIQTLLGPGSMYIDPQVHSYDQEGLQRMVWNDPPPNLASLKEYPKEWKDRCLKEHSTASESQAQTGQALFLVGGRWSKACRTDSDAASKASHGVLHRSPINVPQTKGRVLLILDVLLHDAKEPCDCCMDKDASKASDILGRFLF